MIPIKHLRWVVRIDDTGSAYHPGDRHVQLANERPTRRPQSPHSGVSLACGPLSPQTNRSDDCQSGLIYIILKPREPNPNSTSLPNEWDNAYLVTTTMEIHGILKTPVEIRSAILRQLPRVEDIFSAIQSNRSLYEALGEDKTTVSHVLHKQIDAKLLPYAATCLELDKTLRIT